MILAVIVAVVGLCVVSYAWRISRQSNLTNDDLT